MLSRRRASLLRSKVLREEPPLLVIFKSLHGTLDRLIALHYNPRGQVMYTWARLENRRQLN
jgi:hypothetical protein